MKMLITSGPGSEPIDEVRRITNFSTGELGVLLANALTDAGHEVICYQGSGSTTPLRIKQATVCRFTTSTDLLQLLQNQVNAAPDVVFHTAALSDFTVTGILGPEGQAVTAAKISSGLEAVTIHLQRAPKVLPELRGLFPQVRIVGWKYELEGTRQEALAQGQRQIAEHRTDACVVNGRAYGTAFGFLSKDGSVRDFPDKAALCGYLADWVEGAITIG